MNTKNIDLSSRFNIPQDVLSKTLKDEEVLLNLDSGTYFGLDQVGTFIWHQLKEKNSGEKLLSAVTNEFEIDLETAQQDLKTFISELIENGLVEYSA